MNDETDDDVLAPRLRQAVQLIDSPHAPVFYVDELSGGGPNGTTFNLTFARIQFDYSGGKARAYKQVVMRVVIPIAALQHATKFIADTLEKADRAPPAPPPIPKSNLN